ncbi:hypothetical protein [Streptomyces cyaneofuscatus]|uniref:hypothetical protein n=1 Tax=Streptomyces cyaneofuscatus TaxID=66883 RepID=UPI003645FE6A
MRIRATVAAVSGAIVPSALAVPAAPADEGRSWTLEPGFTAVQPKSGDQGRQAFGATAKAVTYKGYTQQPVKLQFAKKGVK